MRFSRTIACFFGVLALGPAQAVVPAPSGGAYDTIVARNVFRLVPIPHPPETQPAPPQLPKIIVTGITTILHNKRVLLKVLMPARPNEQPTEQLLILTEGERDGVVEVLQINESEATVKLINSGTEMTLSLEKDGAKPATAGAATAGTVAALGQVLPPGPRLRGFDLNAARRGPVGRNFAGPQGAPTMSVEAPPPPPTPATG